jgi:hypothetical protein
MRPLDPPRWEDVVLAVLLLIIGVPRAVLALASDRPLGTEGTLSLVCVVLALAILAHRSQNRAQPAPRL